MGHGPACTMVTGTAVPASSKMRVIPIFLPRMAAFMRHYYPCSLTIERQFPRWCARIMLTRRLFEKRGFELIKTEERASNNNADSCLCPDLHKNARRHYEPV